MDYMNGAKQTIDYIYKDVNRMIKEYGSSTEYDKLKDIIVMARNKVYPSIINDMVVYKSSLEPFITIAKWKEVESYCNKLHNDFSKYNNIRYMYNRWLYMIFNTYVDNIMRYYPRFYVIESLYDCIDFVEYLELTKPEVCFIDSTIKERFKITPIYKKPEMISRSIYKYDPNYKYDDNYTSNTVFALLNKRL